MLHEFLSQSNDDWEWEYNHEVIISEAGDPDEGDPNEDGWADRFPVSALLCRVKQIIQNHYL